MRKHFALLTALCLSITSLPATMVSAAPASGVLAGQVRAVTPQVEEVQYRRGYRRGPPPRGYYRGPPRGYYRPAPPPPRWRGPRRYYNGRYWRPAHNGWYVYNEGAWVAAAALGLAAGAALGAAAAAPSAPPVVVQQGAPVTRTGIPPWTPAWYTYCSRKYKSFNPETGLYLGYDGKYHYCQ